MRASLRVAALAASLLSTQAAHAGDVLWRSVLGGEREYELKQSFAGPDGTVWLFVASRPKGEIGGSRPALELRAVDGDGRIGEPLDPVDALSVPATLDPIFGAVGDKIFAAAVARGQVVLVRFNARLQRAERREVLPLPNRDALVSAIVPVADGEFVVVGRSGRQAWIARVTVELEVVWSRAIDEFPSTVAYDAVANPNGTLTVVGAHVTANGETRIWLATLDAAGKPASKPVFFPGTRARIAADGQGIALLHDRRETSGWDIWARGYSAGLDERWSRRVASGADLRPAFDVAKTAPSRWMATVERERQASLLVGAGKETTLAHTEPRASAIWEALWNVGSPIVSDDGVVLAYTVLTVDESGEQRQVVRVVKVTPVAD